jgi:hypothetical protein
MGRILYETEKTNTGGRPHHHYADHRLSSLLFLLESKNAGFAVKSGDDGPLPKSATRAAY